MNAAEVKEALRGRHPAIDPLGGPGPWTCIEEWLRIDLLAVCAWASARPWPRYARVGYEVKVSRADYRRELARPGKRAAQVAFCHEFYFAVPHGLLKPAEIQWTPPWGFDQEQQPFERARCPGAWGAYCQDGLLHGLGVVYPRSRPEKPSGSRARPFSQGPYPDYSRAYFPTCPTCWGSGWIGESPAVRAGAPPLWIPDDVGLVVVYPEGRVVTAKKAPRRQPWKSSFTGNPWEAGMNDAQLSDLIRWVSYRPDPRHAADRARRLNGSGVLSTD
jgi:hypothetical protein